MKNLLSLCINALVIVILAIGLGRLASSQGGAMFYLGLFVVVLFIAISLYGLTRISSTGKKWLLASYTVVILALLAITIIAQLKVALLLTALLGFLISFPGKPRIKQASESHSVILEPATTTPLKSSQKPKIIKETKTTPLQTEYTPGKYVASNRSNQYHIPLCEWAKKIKPERQLWFKEKENAWERGFRAHSCVKEYSPQRK